MNPRSRVAMIGGGIALAVVVTFAACSGCGKRTAQNPSAAVVAEGGAAPASSKAVATDGDAGAIEDPILWEAARDGEEEDLRSLAIHAGAEQLLEAARNPALAKTAIKAMGYADGWAQLPYLARTASGKSDDEAKLALDAIVELAARTRKPEDVEDIEELKEGCESLTTLAKDASRPRARRVPAIRALRMMPCPKVDLPTDVDAK